jgi:hypothetical protein
MSLARKLRKRIRKAFPRREPKLEPIRPELLRPGEGPLWSRAPIDPNALRTTDAPIAGATQLVSSLCRTELLESDAFRHWLARIGLPCVQHRKLWELGFVMQACFERGLLAPGKRGLAFAVGREPLPAFFASFGCSIVATDLVEGDPRTQVWEGTGQWAAGLEALRRPDLCDDDSFRERVSFRPADMNEVPGDLRDFDFTWSMCAFEHCGTIPLGLRFLERQMDCLRPGGFAIHTTEFNLGSNDATLERGTTVIFRRRDIEEVLGRLAAQGHRVAPLDLWVGDRPADAIIARPPYEVAPHMRLQLSRWPATSLGLIVQKAS